VVVKLPTTLRRGHIVRNRGRHALAVEYLTNDVNPPAGAPNGLHRPLGVGLRNNGDTTRAWLVTNQTYQLNHDGVGWVVSSPLWTNGRVYRLFNGSSFASDLAAVDISLDEQAIVRLEPQRRYRLRFDGPALLLIEDDSTRQA
jgi:hypothetical protein